MDCLSEKEELGSGAMYRLYRQHEREGGSVLVKTIEGSAHPKLAARALRKEFSTGRELQIEGVVSPIELREAGEEPVLLLRDSGGIPLDRLLRDGALELRLALRVARQVAGALAEFHLRGYIHRDLQPCNLLVDPETGGVELHGLGAATKVPRSVGGIHCSGLSGSAPAYASPEFSGRTNRLMDYRTDLYSLGVILFEMVTGRRPFEGEDPLELIHFHAAKLPPLAVDLNPEIPPTLSAIIDKLLAKSADDRYQGGRGLQHDLNRCLEALEGGREVPPFVLAECDLPARFELPQRFYGRSKELARLEAGLEEAGRGTLRVVMVAGSAGVGKSSLVLELQRSVLARRGWFTSGKYDVLDRGAPYSGILEALRNLWRRLLTEEPERVARCRQALEEALGQNLGVIVSVTPELASLVGETPPIPRLDPPESKNRFHLCFQQTLRALATPDSPLVLFLDDLQWADQSSLELIEGALEKELENLLLVGAYRDAEVDERHPLLHSLARISEKEIPVETVALDPLGLADVEQLVADALRARVEEIAPQAELLFRKSAGNAFFTRTLLTEASQRGLLKLKRDGGWSCDLSAIGELESAGDPLELASRRIEQMPAGVRRTISLAAALGHHLDLENLAAVCERSVEEVERDLVVACREGILLKHDLVYRFEHDRLQESAYALIPVPERTHTHLRIARLLDRQEGNEAAGRRIFVVLNHLNRALELLEEPEERRRTALLNLDAGRMAKGAAAFPAAHHHFCCGLALLPEDGWEHDYELTLALHNEAAESALLIADFREANRLVKLILERARGVLDRISAYETEIAIAHSRLREGEALSITLEAVRQLGVEIPPHPTIDEARAMMLRVWQKAERALQHPHLSPGDEHAEELAAMRLLGRASVGAGMVNHPLYLAIASKLFELALRHGNSPEAPLAYVAMGGMLCYVVDDYQAGGRVGRRGMELLEHSAPRLKSFCHFLFAIDVGCWLLPSQDLVEKLMQARRMGLDCGDFLAAGLSAYFCCEIGLISGMELSRLESLVTGYYAECRNLGVERLCAGLLRLELVARTLKNGNAPTAEPIASELGKGWHTSADQTVEEVTACHDMMIFCIYRQRDRALEIALKVDALPLGAVAGLLPSDFYICLSLLEALQRAPAPQHATYLGIAASRQQRLRLKAQACPVNYRHRLDLVEALRLRLVGETVAAMEMFDAAISGARKSGFIQEEALACELTAEFYRSLGRERIAATYLKAAASAYRSWGSPGKLRQLHERHPDCFVPGDEKSGRSGDEPEKEGALAPATLDIACIERAAAALSGELDLSRLLENLLRILLQNAGAERGFLLREEQGKIFVEAQGSVDEERVQVLPPTLLEGNEGLSRSIVLYVSRALETVVIGDARRDPRFSSTSYVLRERPKSILCSCVLHGGKVVAILYLENNLVCDAFNADRLAAIQVISSQAGVALEHARLLESMKQEVKTRRQAEEKLLKALDEVARLKDRLHAENAYLREEISGSHGFDEIVGKSEVLKKVLAKVAQVAATDATVLIQGETGTGKELIARAIHNRSHRRQNAMVRVNCATLPATLIESELFGHEKGAFTGAMARKVGRFELADGSSIFLDEIGELPLELQAKLLRVLQEGEFERVGSATTHKVNARVIAATNRDLKQEVLEGRFRSDLYYRLSVFPIELPPLRSRSEDIPLLVWYFIESKRGDLGKEIDKVPKEVMEALRSYPWPGNIRELENVIERALILSRGRALALDDSLGMAQPQRFQHSGSANLDNVEKSHIISVLEQCRWKVKGEGNAAERLGLKPSTLFFRMKKLGIERAAARG
jgi:transcriptional regulator with GAF, ATPase, and Fis domain/predicted ATPase